MHSTPHTQALITAVAGREWAGRLGAIAGRSLVISAGIALAVLIVFRLTGFHVEWINGSIVLVPLAVALTAGLMFARRPSAAQTARLLDERLQRADLFKTCLNLAHAPGAYQSIVKMQAEQAATAADPRIIRPFAPRRLVGRAAVALAVLGLAVVVMPVLDPFGTNAARERLAQRKNLLTQQKIAAKERVAALTDEKPQQPLSDAVTRDLVRLAATFDALKVGLPQANQSTLAKENRTLAKNLAEHQAVAFKPENSEQMLGGDAQIAKSLSEALTKGDDRKIADELEATRKLAEALAKNPDPQQAEAQRKELQRRLEGLQQALGRRGQAAGKTVQQALDQLAQAGDPRTRDQALEALESSLDQLGAELQCLGREARDVEALKQALSACRLAKQLDDQGKLPSDCKKGCSLSEYAQRYSDCLGNGAGSAPGGKGMGPGGKPATGGKAKENDQAQTDFTSEKSPSQLTAGQTILQWKTKGPSESGVAEERYQQAVKQARQEATEALTQEDLPPSYQQTVKTYFDGLGK